jgi:hypothetical protein
MSRIEGSTALVTGGASGLGYLVAGLLLERGAAHVLICDVDAGRTEQAARELGSAGRRSEGMVVDITDRTAVQSSLAELHARGVAIDLLVNNAGIIIGRDFTGHSDSDIGRTMAVNAVAPMQLAAELLPGMIARGRGHVVNIASAAGLVANPGMSVYCASKWALIGWSDSLRLELADARTGVRVTTVLPYYTDTGMFAGVRSPVIPILKPARVARAIVAGIERDRSFVHVPWYLRFVPLLRGLLPTPAFDHVADEWLGIYRSMRSFKGRSS